VGASIVKKAILIILGVIVLLVVGFVVVVAMQPNEMHIERSATIPSPPAVVFDQVNNMEKSQEWSPWRKLDPNAKYTYAGPPAGEGAKISWDGNDEVGAGSMAIVESKPNEHLKMALEFTRPMQDKSDIIYTFKPADGGEATEVTWAMHGDHTFMSKAMCLFMDMDAMVGKSFEEGLANLKVTSERAETVGETPSDGTADEESYDETPDEESPADSDTDEEPASGD
jgi:uncharacterized protein YndB with AHSA1/START domain